MPDKEMPKEVSIMGGCPVPSMCSPLLYLAEIEAEGKAKKARLRAQQGGRVATRKKGRLRRIVRYVRDNCFAFKVCRPSLRPRDSSPFHRAAQPGRSERQSEPADAVPQMSPAQKVR